MDQGTGNPGALIVRVYGKPRTHTHCFITHQAEIKSLVRIRFLWERWIRRGQINPGRYLCQGTEKSRFDLILGRRRAVRDDGSLRTIQEPPSPSGKMAVRSSSQAWWQIGRLQGPQLDAYQQVNELSLSKP